MNNKSIIKAFSTACNNLAQAVNEQLFDGKCKPYWIVDVVGGLCDFDGYAVLSPAEMALIINNHLTYDQVMEWIDAGVDYNRERESEKYINLDAWIKGARYEMLNDKK